jgi:hypothetical protein
LSNSKSAVEKTARARIGSVVMPISFMANVSPRLQTRATGAAMTS